MAGTPERSAVPSGGTFGHASGSRSFLTSTPTTATPSFMDSTEIDTSVAHQVRSTSANSYSNSPKKTISSLGTGEASDDSAWGSNFWVTLVDPQSGATFFACPATGQVSWDAPVGNFVIPPSTEGEWWELNDESRGGLSYYHHTKTGETVWERPPGFVIPLGILQGSALGRRLSTNSSFNVPFNQSVAESSNGTTESHSVDKHVNRTSRQLQGVNDSPNTLSSHIKDNAQTRRASPQPPTNHAAPKRVTSAPARRSFMGDGHHGAPNSRFLGHGLGLLPPIPGSPYATEASTPPSPSSHRTPAAAGETPGRESTASSSSPASNMTHSSEYTAASHPNDYSMDGIKTSTPAAQPVRSRSRSRSRPVVTHRSPQPQSLNAAVELLTSSQSDRDRGRSTDIYKSSLSESGHFASPRSSSTPRKSPGMSSEEGGAYLDVSSFGELRLNTSGLTPSSSSSPPSGNPGTANGGRSMPASPMRLNPGNSGLGGMRKSSGPAVLGKEISGPVPNPDAIANMSPVKDYKTSKPIWVERSVAMHKTNPGTGAYPMLPSDLAEDIQQFSESAYARQYFSTHRTGFIFRRRVPVAQMMTWQKAPLSSPLLTLNRALSKDAIKVFKVIQRIMGDRERDRPIGVRVPSDTHVSTVAPLSLNASTTSLGNGSLSVLEEERWLLGEGLSHGELRDEIYCQLMKQLSGNPSSESMFKGWQLLCVLLITFPPSKNFETYLRMFMTQRKTQQEGRIDVMAKYCLRRLDAIAKKGPRGKPPSTAEIETAGDAAFNPSTFGESLDAIFRLQERNYPHQRVPIILPFLADGILALGGTKSEGIFRVPGDGDSVSDLKLRIDKGYYTLEGVDEPHVLASLFKLWLRELCDPLVPDEMYNECIQRAQDPSACVNIVERLPTNNRRVVLFVISFLQLFLEDKVQSVTKMTPANLALVFSPNLLRCNSDSMAVVFTNAQYEQIFVYNLLLHLNCSEIDPHYKPVHGLGAVVPPAPSRAPKPRKR